VGAHLAKELKENGIEVIGVGGAHGATEPDTNVSSYQVLDLSIREEVEQIDFRTIDGVIHLAGLAAVGPSFDDPMGYIATNIGIEVNLFEVANQQGAKPKFLIISSGSLYDPQAPLPLTELSSVVPSSPYAVSKLGQEQMSQYYGLRGFECVIARPFNHIGPGQNPGFLVPDLAQQVIEFERGKRQDILVGNLDAKRDYTDVRDIVRAYRLLLEKGTAGKVYNVCSGTARSGNEILKLILSASSGEPAVTKDPARMRPSDAPEIYGNYAAIEQDTGWKPEIDITNTIADVLADWRAR
jgi:GDP-4-dehydro-6-deoxy-D-mannose reductase